MSATQSTIRVQSTPRAPSVRSARLAAVLLAGGCAALLATHAASPPAAAQAASPAAAAPLSAAVTWTVTATVAPPPSGSWQSPGLAWPSTSWPSTSWPTTAAMLGDYGAVASVVESVGDFVGTLAPGADSLGADASGAGVPTVTVRISYPAAWEVPVTDRR